MTYTLVAEGSSDKILLPILTWSLKQHAHEPVEEQWADFSRIPRQQNVEAKMRVALELYPCDVLFVHRDAERQPVEWRRTEIANSLNSIPVLYVPVVPVRMTEAWLLVDELSIRAAAGNPGGTENLDLPSIETLEDVPDPKRVLHSALVTACGLNARRRSRFPVQQRVHLVAQYIEDYSVLNALPAFRLLQQDILSLTQGGSDLLSMGP